MYLNLSIRALTGILVGCLGDFRGGYFYGSGNWQESFGKEI